MDKSPRTGQAKYFDGKTSKPQSAVLRITPDGLIIETPAVPVALRWYFRDLQNQDEYIKGRALTLVSKQAPLEHLVVDDPQTIALILDALPRRNRSMARVPLSAMSILVMVGVSVLLIGATVLLVKHSGGMIAAMIPEVWEDTLAENLVPQLDEARHYAEKYPCRAAVQSRLLTALLKKLPDVPETDKIKIIISPDSEVNAFALPGNMIIVNQGLIDFAQHEQEILGVLAHERAHIQHRHVMKSVVQALGLRVVLWAMTGGDGSNIAAAGSQIFQMGYSRDFEREADQTAVKSLQAVGLSAVPLADFFSRLEKKEQLVQQLEKYEIIGYFTSHPFLRERIDVLAPAGMKTDKPLKSLLPPGGFAELKKAKMLACQKVAP